MKIIYSAIFTFAFCFFLACKTHQDISPVFDMEQDLNAQQVDSLEKLIISHEEKTTNQIAMITTADYGRDATITDFAIRFGRDHGVGIKGKNNGLVLAFSKARRKVQISTGYGLEKILTDSVAQKIIDSIMVPEFRKDEYFTGIWKGCKAVTSFLEKPENKVP